MKAIASTTQLSAIKRLSSVAGVDEAGRGPLAGPVIAAVVILDPKHQIKELTDSKLLNAIQREKIYAEIIENSIAYAVGRADVDEIDEMNIHFASLLAMQRAINSLTHKPEHILVDGKFCPIVDYPTTAIVKGDLAVPAISAASIVAKVTRDREMIEYDRKYPNYGFADHKGYTTNKHLNALDKYGVSPIHRKTYAPVRVILERDRIETV